MNFLNNYPALSERDVPSRTFFNSTNKTLIPTDNTQFQRLGYPENTTDDACRHGRFKTANIAQPSN